MATTPRYGWRYQAPGDLPDGAALGRNADLDIEATVGGIDDSLTALTTTVNGIDDIATVWTTYTPTWTASTTNPTIGNGTITGRYKIVGKLCYFWLLIAFGSTTNAGSGVYSFGFPPGVTAHDGASSITFGFRDQSAALQTMGFGTYSALASTFDGRVVGANQAGSASPYPWGSGDFIRAWGFVELA